MCMEGLYGKGMYMGCVSMERCMKICICGDMLGGVYRDVGVHVEECMGMYAWMFMGLCKGVCG